MGRVMRDEPQNVCVSNDFDTCTAYEHHATYKKEMEATYEESVDEAVGVIEDTIWI